VGRSTGTFDAGPGEQDDFRAALDFLHEKYPGAPVWAGGMSFGSWIALSVGADDPRVSTLIGISMPLSRYDFTPVTQTSKPKFFIQAERDEICPRRTRGSFTRAPPSRRSS